MKLRECKIDEYESFISSQPTYNFLNDSVSIEFMKNYGFETHYLIMEDQGKAFAATPICLNRIHHTNFNYAYAQRGFLLDYDNQQLLEEFHTQLLVYLNSKAVLYLKIDPYILYQQHDPNGEIVEGGFNNQKVIDSLIHLGYKHQGFTIGMPADCQVRWMFVLSLENLDEEKILKQMDQQTRWSVNKTIKTGIETKQLEYNELPIFEQIMTKTAARRGFTKKSLEYYQSMYQMYDPEKAKFIISYINKKEFLLKAKTENDKLNQQIADLKNNSQYSANSTKEMNRIKALNEIIVANEKRIHRISEEKEDIIPLSVALFIVNGNEIVYYLSGTDEKYREYLGPYAIQWAMIKYALAHQIRTYNFYGMTGDFSPKADDYGVYKFKKGFGGTVEELIGDFIYPVKPTAYRLYSLYRKLK
jgi:peptidoglycan pentaglycine glycine transferase (the second and third glycine)